MPMATTRIPKEEVRSMSQFQMDTCLLCGTPIPKDGAPLCPDCLEDQEEKWRDYQAEQEQARRPF